MNFEVLMGPGRRRRGQSREYHSLEKTQRKGDIEVVRVGSQDRDLETICSFSLGVFGKLGDVNLVLVNKMGGRPRSPGGPPRTRPQRPRRLEALRASRRHLKMSNFETRQTSPPEDFGPEKGR